MLSAYGLYPGEIVVDNFAGGGGASTGISEAIGRSVDIAINHDPEAIRMHKANHPTTHHYCESVWEVDPVEACRGRPVGIAWFSPDCRHFSKARGGTPVRKEIRGLAWVALRWASKVKPRMIFLENVEEFLTWGPVKRGADGREYPCEKRKGKTFSRFIAALEGLGYQVDWRVLRASEYGAPTIRKRLFLVARCDGFPIAWPEKTHGPGALPFRSAASCIDFSIPTHSIFLGKEEGTSLGVRRPLADATCRRIAEGVMRYVVRSPDPFVMPSKDDAGDNGDLVAAFLAKHYTGVVGVDVREPMPTITAKDHNALVLTRLREVKDGVDAESQWMPFVIKFYSSGGQWQDLRDPMHTIPAKDRMGLVVVKGRRFAITDIGMRMLTPRELYRAQGFPEDYIIDGDAEGVFTKASQVARCGNSVSPVMATALVSANLDIYGAMAA